MRYINIKTGAIIDSPSKIISKKWKVIEEVEAEEVEDELDEEDEEVEEIKSFEDIKVEEIKEELDFLGIKYNSKAKKQELYDLMIQGR